MTIPDASPSPDDLYFHIKGPSDSSWIGKGADCLVMILSNRGAGLGFGENMRNALMLIVYAGGKNKSGMHRLLERP